MIVGGGKRFAAAFLALALLTGGGGPTRAAENVTAPALAGSAALHLVVRHALEAGRLVVRIGNEAFFSAPLRALGGSTPGRSERLLSVPAGEQTITVLQFDGRGRVVAEKQARGNVSAPTPAILDVVTAGVAGGAGLSVAWRNRP